MNPITILLAEDHPVIREGLRALLKFEQDFEIVGEAENGRQAVSLASKLCPDVIVMDISMPILNGLEATREILQHLPTTRVLMLSAHTEQAYIDKVVALGASGYLFKQTVVQVLPRAIREIIQGSSFFYPPLFERRINSDPKFFA